VGIVTTIFTTLFGWISGLFDCTGAVVVDRIVYYPDALNNLTQHQKLCDTKKYSFESPHDACGKENSSYSVTYCLERLDAPDRKSAAVALLPGGGATLLSLAVVLLFGGFGVSV
jgi:hypothetical protein